MSTTAKTVLVIVVVAVLAVIAYFAYQHGRTAPITATQNMQYPSQQAVLPSGNDTSDAGLAKDTAAIDANLNGVSSDNASADQSASGYTAP